MKAFVGFWEANGINEFSLHLHAHGHVADPHKGAHNGNRKMMKRQMQHIYLLLGNVAFAS